MKIHSNDIRIKSLLLTFVVFFLTAATASGKDTAKTPLYEKGAVQLESGMISGTAAVRNKEISAFKGIPYAQPPLGDLRWKPPVAVKPWKGIRPAVAFGPAAPQETSAWGVTEDIWQSEDCLYLNVWTPAKSKEENLPVMVWIHGGGFRIGSTSNPSYNGSRLAEKGVVVVSINYRLNFFGQFAHPLLTAESGHNASGNYGLMDQIAALKWVQKNIRQFGGDPNRVTIFGESAGSRSVTLLVASPLAEGLFHRGICESGAVRDVSTPRKVREEQCVKIAEKLGAETLEELRALDYEDFYQAGDFDSNPIVDGWVIPRDAEILYAEGKINKVPLIIGINADEGTLWLMDSKIDTLEKYTGYIKSAYGDNAQKILDAYAPIAKKDVKDALNHISTDSRMLFRAIQQADWLEDIGQDSYFYFFTKVPPTRGGKLLKAHHGAEIPYMLGNIGPRWGKVEQVDLDLSHAMMTYWTQFAATGNPNTEGLPKWPVYDGKTHTYLELGDEIKAKTGLRSDKIKMWGKEIKK